MNKKYIIHNFGLLETTIKNKVRLLELYNEYGEKNIQGFVGFLVHIKNIQAKYTPMEFISL